MLTLSSPAFTHAGKIPRRYTCQGEDVSPPLAITGVPPKTKSLVLLMEDPDVPPSIRPDRLWIHWVLYNLMPTTKEIREGEAAGGVEGLNTGKTPGYMGPCPPDREHRYFFKLYALDCELSLRPSPTREVVLQAMEGHIIEMAELMGRYEKSS